MVRQAEFKKLIILLLICFLPGYAMAEKFKYVFNKSDTLSYTVAANSHVDLTKIGAIAAVFQITNLSQNTFLGVDLTVESLTKNSEATIKALFKQVSLVMIKNDSVMTSDGSNWGGLKQGTIHNFAINPEGRIQPLAAKSGAVNPDMLILWQILLPQLPTRSINKGESWVDSVVFPLAITGMPPARVVCKMNYTYFGNESNNSKRFDRFDYTIEGTSAQNKSIHISGKGLVQFDNETGKLFANNCEFEMQGAIDLALLGLPAELNASLPLTVKTQATVKLQNEN